MQFTEVIHGASVSPHKTQHYP